MPAPTCLLVVHGRGGLPWADLHGEPVHVHAARALVEAARRLGSAPPEVVADDADAERVARDLDVAGLALRVEPPQPPAAASADAGGLLVHDALCPLAPPDFLEQLGRGPTAMGVRPVTDTVKTVDDGRIRLTLDRDRLVAVASPARIEAGLLAEGRPPLSSFPALLGWLRERGPVELVRAPSMARRVETASALTVLESVDELAGRVRTGRGHP